MIRRIELAEIDKCLLVIQESFATVAKEFGITKLNCPNHTSFMKAEKLQKQFSEGCHMFAYIDNQKIVGYFSLTPDGNSRYELNNLAVLPEYRHKGYGKEMITFAIDEVQKLGCNIITIGIIEENTRLKNWYKDLGFKHTGTKKFEHLPFTVGFMEISL